MVLGVKIKVFLGQKLVRGQNKKMGGKNKSFVG